MYQVHRGERLPEPKEAWTLRNSIKRTVIVTRNKTFKNTWEYESDEDEGEDLGSAVDFEEENFDLGAEAAAQ